MKQTRINLLVKLIVVVLLVLLVLLEPKYNAECVESVGKEAYCIERMEE